MRGNAEPAVACAAAHVKRMQTTSCLSRKVENDTTLPMVRRCAFGVTDEKRETNKPEHSHRRTRMRFNGSETAGDQTATRETARLSQRCATWKGGLNHPNLAK